MHTSSPVSSNRYTDGYQSFKSNRHGTTGGAQGSLIEGVPSQTRTTKYLRRSRDLFITQAIRWLAPLRHGETFPVVLRTLTEDRLHWARIVIC